MKKRMLPIILCFALLLAGIAVLLYPSFSNRLLVRSQTVAIQQYNLTVDELTEQETEKQLAMAAAYNASLSGRTIRDPFIPGSRFALPEGYTDVLNVNGVMANIEIPTLETNLPIYHGTGEAVLQRGVGHLDATAFPIGGPGNHSVLIGHSGLPTARLFTHLDRLVLGDVFYIHVLNRILAYQVNQILVVNPSDTSALHPVKEKDYITLVTCTPYAINSHRLLVRGERIPYAPTKTSALRKQADILLPWALVSTVLALGSAVLLGRAYRSHKQKKAGGKR